MGIFTEPPLEPWEKARADAYRALKRAERLHAAVHRMMERIEQSMIHRAPVRHRSEDEREPSLGEQEIQRDEVRREAERSMSLEASFGRAIKEALTILGGKKP